MQGPMRNAFSVASRSTRLAMGLLTSGGAPILFSHCCKTSANDAGARTRAKPRRSREATAARREADANISRGEHRPRRARGSGVAAQALRPGNAGC
jgi:hypothetical protein